MIKDFQLEVLREHAFAIADPECAEHLPMRLATERLVPKGLAASAHLMPILIDLQQSPISQLTVLAELIRNGCEHTHASSVAVLIKTRASATETTRHWNAIQCPRPYSGRKLWLRLHDPRVLHQILRILRPPQRRKLFSLSTALTYWIAGEWITVERDFTRLAAGHSGIDANVESYAGTEKWDWPRIERIGLINRALRRLEIQTAASLTSGGALAEQLLERAAGHYGFADNADLVEFASRGLQTNPTFDEHPLVARFIHPPAASEEASSLTDRFALIDEQVWIALNPTKNKLPEAQI